MYQKMCMQSSPPLIFYRAIVMGQLTKQSTLEDLFDNGIHRMVEVFCRQQELCEKGFSVASPHNFN